MTTVMGIAGQDPASLEYYVVMASDTRGTSARTGINADVQKIFGNESSNLVIAGAGRCLADCFPSQSNIAKFVENPEFTGRYALKSSFDDMEKYMQLIGERNEYLAAVKEEKPKLYLHKKGELHNILSYKVVGSGSDLVWSFDRLPWRECDGRVELTKQEVISEMAKAFNYVAQKDCYTGGNIDVAIITPRKIEILRNYDQIKTSRMQNNSPLWKDQRETVYKHPLYDMDE